MDVFDLISYIDNKLGNYNYTTLWIDEDKRSIGIAIHKDNKVFNCKCRREDLTYAWIDSLIEEHIK
jgi:hypothetical protein